MTSRDKRAKTERDVDPRAMAVDALPDETRTHGGYGDETEVVQNTTGALIGGEETGEPEDATEDWEPRDPTPEETRDH